MKKQWSDVEGLPIVVSEDERPLAYLNGLFMNPETGQIIGFLAGYTKVLVPSDIERWRLDYVQVRGFDSLAPANDILRIRKFGLRRSFLNGKRVRSKSGKGLGRVRDFCFETSTNSVLNIEVSKRFLWIEWAKRIFSYREISEVTERAIIVTAEPEVMIKNEAQIPLPS